MKHFISLKDLSRDEIIKLVELTAKVKKNPRRYQHKLHGKHIGLLFQKPSLRTKASFYLGALQLGAQVIYFAPDEVKIGEREAISDAARTISRYMDCIVFRTFSHRTIKEFAKYSTASVINALSNLLHPSQVLGDLFTLYELKKDINKIKLAYIGDGNNVCHSLLYAFSILGGSFCAAVPKGYEPDAGVLSECKTIAAKSGAVISIVHNPEQAVRGAEVVYTDVWTSMGEEKDKDLRREAFESFQVNEALLKSADKNCIVMHCLPAHRGEEITDEVIDGPRSVVFLQAENRLHSAKAILLDCV